MTADTAADIAEAFLELRSAFGVPATLPGSAVVVVMDESTLSRTLSEGGWTQDGEVQGKVLLADLPGALTIGATAEYKGQPYRVKEVATQPGALVGEFTLRPTKR